jgi:hypothetical protein
MRAACIAVVVALSATAHADPPRPEPVSESAATWAAAATVGSLMLVGAGLSSRESGKGPFTIGVIGTFIAPAIGHLRARHYFTRGTALRLVGLMAIYTGGKSVLDNQDCHDLCGDSDEEARRGAYIALGGLAVYVAGMVDDLVTAPRVIRDFNARHAITVAPVVGQGSTGAAISGRF